MADRQLNIVEKLASSKGGAWYFIHVSGRIDPWLLKRTDGRLSSLPGAPVLLLQHTGAKSGKARETALTYTADGDAFVLTASNGGSEQHPAWYHNLRANPECRLVVKGASGDYVAEELEGDEYERVWELALDVYGGYAVYQDRTGGRKIPLMRLTQA
ncbi:MAG: nitroreductase family deazaflavin-dependent oxidoreductase [Actinomycetota bacterium]